MKNTYSYKDIFENFSTFFLFLCGFFWLFSPLRPYSKPKKCLIVVK